MLAALSQVTWGRVLGKCSAQYPLFSNVRRFVTSGNGKNDNSSKPGDEGEEEEEEDEFGLSGFDMDVSDEGELDATLKEISESSTPVTQELASDLVERIVQSASRSLTETTAPRSGILHTVTKHTVAVMRASRISTNTVEAAVVAGHDYPIVRKVTGIVDIARLGLSKPAEEVLKQVAGPRVRDGIVKISSTQYPSKAENELHVVSLIDRLVSGAKYAVGDSLDASPLESWGDVLAEVERQAEDEIAEAGDVSQLLGEQKI